jgi:actin-related protein
MKILETFGIENLGSVVEYDHDPYTSWWVSRIIITGGASNILGLRSLLIRELLKATEIKRYDGCERAPSNPLVDVEFRDVAFTIRNVPLENTPSTWLGASIESSLKAFKEIFVSNETYQNNSEIVFQLNHEDMWSSLLKK